jgi:hypothetical protein
MNRSLPVLIATAMLLFAGVVPRESLAQARGENDALAGAWEGKVQFSAGAFAAVKDLRFMYAFMANGTMLESSNYDAAPPVPPAYGVWKKTSARQYLAKYRFYVSSPVASADELIKGGGWGPGGYGVLTEKIELAADGMSFVSTLSLELFDKDGKSLGDGGAATGSAQRLGF